MLGSSRTAEPELEQHWELSPVDGPGGPQLLLPAGPAPLPGNAETDSQLSQENISKWDRFFFAVLKPTLANATARCADLSDLFSAAILKRVIIVCCVSKAGPACHVTEL